MTASAKSQSPVVAMVAALSQLSRSFMRASMLLAGCFSLRFFRAQEPSFGDIEHDLSISW
jgi:hypothetical protein